MYKYLSQVVLVSILMLLPGCWCKKNNTCKPYSTHKAKKIDNNINKDVEMNDVETTGDEMASLEELYDEITDEDYDEELNFADTDLSEKETPRKM